MTVSSFYSSVAPVYAMSGIVTVGAGAAFGLALSLLGIAASKDTYKGLQGVELDNAVNDWGMTQRKKFETYLATNALKYGYEVTKVPGMVEKWADDVGRGVVDTSSKVWQALKDFGGDIYDKTHEGAGDIVLPAPRIPFSLIYGDVSVYSGYSTVISKGFDSSKMGVLKDKKSGGYCFLDMRNVSKFTVDFPKFYNGVLHSAIFFDSSVGRFWVDSSGRLLSDRPSWTTWFYSYCVDYVGTGEAEFFVVSYPFDITVDDSILDYPKHEEEEQQIISGIPAADVRNLELTKNPSGEKELDLQAIADALGMTVAELLAALAAGTVTYDKLCDVVGVEPVVIDKPIDTPLPPGTDDKEDSDIENPPYVPESDGVVDGLKDLFPFCIPFDLYDLFDCLDAEPQAPRFVFDCSFLGEQYKDLKLTLDLKDFEEVAEICRNLELLTFCIALVVITRNLIRG